MDVLRWLAERRIQAAIDEGAFDDLAGSGKPLTLDPFEDAIGGEWRLAHHMLKSAGMAPRWIELDEQIRLETAAARVDLQRARDRWPEGGVEWQRAQDRFQERAGRVNRRVLVRNFLAPESVKPRFPLILERELARLRTD